MTIKCLSKQPELTTYLLKRGYNRNFVTKQIRRAADIPRRLSLQTKDVNKPKRRPFITTFNPSLPHISNIIKKHYNLLLSSNRCKNVFQHLLVSICFLLLCSFIMLFYFTVCLSSIYTINYFCVFPVLRNYRLHKNTHQCKIFHCT